MTHGQGLAGLRTLNSCKSQGKCRSCPGGRRPALGWRGSPWPLCSPAVRHTQQACPPKSSVSCVSRHTCLPCRGLSLTPDSRSTSDPIPSGWHRGFHIWGGTWVFSRLQRRPQFPCKTGRPTARLHWATATLRHQLPSTCCACLGFLRLHPDQGEGRGHRQVMSAADEVECVPGYTMPDLELGLKEGRTQHTRVCVWRHLGHNSQRFKTSACLVFHQTPTRIGPCFMGRTEGRRD